MFGWIKRWLHRRRGKTEFQIVVPLVVFNKPDQQGDIFTRESFGDDLELQWTALYHRDGLDIPEFCAVPVDEESAARLWVYSQDHGHWIERFQAMTPAEFEALKRRITTAPAIWLFGDDNPDA